MEVYVCSSGFWLVLWMLGDVDWERKGARHFNFNAVATSQTEFISVSASCNTVSLNTVFSLQSLYSHACQIFRLYILFTFIQTKSTVMAGVRRNSLRLVSANQSYINLDTIVFQAKSSQCMIVCQGKIYWKIQNNETPGNNYWNRHNYVELYTP